MGGRRLFCKVLRDGVSQATLPAGSSFSSRMASSMPRSMESLRSSHAPLNYSTKAQHSSWYRRAEVCRHFSGNFTASRSQNRKFSGTMVVQKNFLQCSPMRTAGMHTGRIAEAPEPTYGVGPVGGADRDPESKGSTPDDFRADYIHMAEPKEIAKGKAAIAQEEPPDFQVRKMMPQWQKPVEEKADSQRGSGDKVFEGDTRQVEGTAEKQGDTTGNESGDKVEGQYGGGSSEGTTSRA